jgi:ATP-dependent exoDNAse (exonuclease V) alpha subunit
MEQEKAKELILAGHNAFITGSAGTGKTYTLNQIIKELKRQGKRVATTASTGIASTHLNGTTIHSWAGIGIKEPKQLTTDELFKLKNNFFTKSRIKNADVLIIDEISMLHDYRLDMVDEVCRFVRGNADEPFGGLQIIACGDFFQLPPVTKGGKGNKHYCFNAISWERANLKICYLKKIYRQEKDLVFIDILNNIRSNSLNQNHLDILSNLSGSSMNGEAINLFCKNISVDALNNAELAKIDSDRHTYQMMSDGIDFKIANLKKNCLAPEVLTLKEGAHVMFLVNDFNRKIVNGTMGEVVDFTDHTVYDKDGNEVASYEGLPVVKIFKTQKKEIAIPHKWENEEWDESTGKNVVKASITQLPLKLAWSVTIHKSQGATFDYVDLDLTDVFEQNMGYVALSRATSLEGIRLKGYNELAFSIDENVIQKDAEFQMESERNE